MRTDILQQARAIRASMDAAAIALTDEQATKAPVPASIAPNASNAKAAAIYSNGWNVGFLGLTMGSDIGLLWNLYSVDYSNGKLSFTTNGVLSVNSNYISTIFMTY